VRGDGFNLTLDYLPLNGTDIVIRQLQLTAVYRVVVDDIRGCAINGCVGKF
jgi:hypothetical protein